MESELMQGQIYRIFSTTAGTQYIGSTIQLLAKRFESHCASYNTWQKNKKNFLASFIILKHDDAEIELIESYECSDEDALHQREQYWIDNTPCVNLASAAYDKAGSHRIYRCETCGFVTCMQTKYNSHVLHNKCFGSQSKTTKNGVANKAEKVDDVASRSTGGAVVMADATGDIASRSTGDVASRSTGDVASRSTGDVASRSTGDVASRSTGDVASRSTGGVTYTCSRCNYQTNKKSNYDKHINRVTQCGPKDTSSTNTNNTQCRKCGYCVKSSSGLTRHLQVCNGRHPFECKDCGTRFTTRMAKNRHNRTIDCKQLNS
jgi:hypothetical protein